MEKQRQALSEINVTPFVDVMLVLLVIFMVTAPLLQQGMDVNLPKTSGKELTPSERIVITIKKDGAIYIDKSPADIEGLKTALAGKSGKDVFLKADREVPYGLVVEVMGELKEIGIERLGMVTEPKTLFK
jgi:biopolymer transport protein TolR